MTGKTTGKRSYTKHFTQTCLWCGTQFIGNRLAKYHSNACRQAAYRAHRSTPIERAIAKADRYRRMLATKASTIITTKCCGCGCEMTVTALQGRGKMYHNNACKQRAYRERKAYRESIQSNQ